MLRTLSIAMLTGRRFLETPVVLGGIALITGLPACTTSPSTVKVTIHESIAKDESYAEILERHSHRVEVNDSFATLFIMHSTLLSAKMRSALAERYQRIHSRPQPLLDESTDKTGFIVSISTSDPEFRSLDSSEHWSLKLEAQGQEFSQPALIQTLRDKPKLSPFFAGIDTWSYDYLVVFDTPTPSAADDQLLDQESLVLTIGNAQASVRFAW